MNITNMKGLPFSRNYKPRNIPTSVKTFSFRVNEKQKNEKRFILPHETHVLIYLF
jgi:hypothetical protein